jgi:hypothetical protein
VKKGILQKYALLKDFAASKCAVFYNKTKDVFSAGKFHDYDSYLVARERNPDLPELSDINGQVKSIVGRYWNHWKYTWVYKLIWQNGEQGREPSENVDGRSC